MLPDCPPAPAPSPATGTRKHTCQPLHRPAPAPPLPCAPAHAQVGPFTDLRLRCLLDLADQAIFEPCYDTLRTKQQLGYSVHSGTRQTHGVLGFCVSVVSAAFAPAEVEARAEAFLAAFADTLRVRRKLPAACGMPPPPHTHTLRGPDGAGSKRLG